jgi:hypothetical protein
VERRPRVEVEPVLVAPMRVRQSGSPRAGVKKAAPPSQRVPGELEQEATVEDERTNDVLRAKEIYAQMEVDRRLSDEKIRAMWADVQTEVFRIWQEVLLRRQKVMADLMDKWSKILFG